VGSNRLVTAIGAEPSQQESRSRQEAVSRETSRAASGRGKSRRDQPPSFGAARHGHTARYDSTNVPDAIHGLRPPWLQARPG
jgi:hypothetical protein